MKIPFTNIEIGRSTSREDKVVAAKEEGPVDVRVKSGRQTEPEGVNLLSALSDQFETINPDYPIEYVDIIIKLAQWNSDVSQAVENIVALGNTDWTVTFDDKVSDAQAKEMMAYLNRREKRWYDYSGGVNSLRNDLLAQIATTGALSAEMVPENDLSGIKKAVLVAPKGIVFKYDSEQEGYMPYQRRVATISGTYENLQALNPVTYKYYALRRFSEKPYAIPPFLAALESIEIEKSMLVNFKAIIKKLGLLGFLEVLITPPKPLPSHNPNTDEGRKAYEAYAQTRIDAAVAEVEKGMSKGYVVGSKGSHEFSMEGTSHNVQGAKDMFELITTLKMSGLKQDPMMLGRNFSTTETLGRVLLAKLASQVRNYQDMVDAFQAQMYHLDLLLAGYKVEWVEVRSEEPMIGDEVREITAKKTKADYLRGIYQDGIIGQEERAKELGYENADQPEPRAQANSDGGEDPNTDPDPTDGNTTEPNSAEIIRKASPIQAKRLLGYAESKLSAKVPVFPYEAMHDHYGSFEKYLDALGKTASNKKLAGFMQKYFGDLSGEYGKAAEKAGSQIASLLFDMGDGASLQEVTDKVLASLYTNWDENFGKGKKKIVKKYIAEIYDSFRKDKNAFGGKKKITLDGVATDIPEATFNLIDFRTIEYYAASDELYLGKFITDSDTKKKITQFIKTEYLEGNTPIGKNQAAMNKFRANFKDVLVGEEWKIERVISTTVNKMRNYGAVQYMSQAGVQKFKIVGVTDRLQCEYCAELQDKEFAVEKEVERISTVVQSEPELISQDSPFVTSLFKNAEEMRSFTDEQLQDLGVSIPAHPRCRDQYIAI
jgi:hypothetical protein